MEALARANPGEEWLQTPIEVPPAGAKPAAWHEFYWRAWQVLQFDRQYGAMGGETPISFVALDAYARRYGIEGEAFDRFIIFMTAIDDEWLEYKSEKAKAAGDASLN